MSPDIDGTNDVEKSDVVKELKKELQKISAVIENLHTRMATLEAGYTGQRDRPATLSPPLITYLTAWLQ